MSEVTITRTKPIVVNEVGQNEYGDLTFTDKEGNSYKVKKTRRQYFDKIIAPDTAVQLNYAVYMKTEYVYSAEPVAGKLPPSVKVETVPVPGVEIPPQPPKPPPSPAPKPISGQEEGMWWKQLGDDLRSGHIDKTTSQGKLVRRVYFSKMFQVLGIKFDQEGDVK